MKLFVWAASRIYVDKGDNQKMLKRIGLVLIMMMLSVGMLSMPVHAADTLKGTWANLSGSVMYVFDGNGSGRMEHSTHAHRITYTVDGNKLKIAFPDNDGHGLSDSFTFEVIGQELRLTIDGKPSAQRYEKKADNWTRPVNASSNQQDGDTPSSSNQNGNMLLWLLVGGGALIIAIVVFIIVFQKIRKRSKRMGGKHTMSTQNKQMSKKEQRAKAAKKAKIRNGIIISVCAVAVVLIATLVVCNAVRSNKERVYTDGGQTITLRDDGTFTAALAHETRQGTYTESTANTTTTITFTINGTSVSSSIKNNVLTIPIEWQDSHGHGTQLKLK